MLDAMRMRTACFARAPQRYTSRLSKHFLLTLQEVTPPSKTRNQLTAKDLLKQEGCEILGRFFIALICQAAQERASIAEEKRMPTFVYIDEAHDYFDANMENMFNEPTLSSPTREKFDIVDRPHPQTSEGF